MYSICYIVHIAYVSDKHYGWCQNFQNENILNEFAGVEPNLAFVSKEVKYLCSQRKQQAGLPTANQRISN